VFSDGGRRGCEEEGLGEGPVCELGGDGVVEFGHRDEYRNPEEMILVFGIATGGNQNKCRVRVAMGWGDKEVGCRSPVSQFIRSGVKVNLPLRFSLAVACVAYLPSFLQTFPRITQQDKNDNSHH